MEELLNRQFGEVDFKEIEPFLVILAGMVIGGYGFFCLLDLYISEPTPLLWDFQTAVLRAILFVTWIFVFPKLIQFLSP